MPLRNRVTPEGEIVAAAAHGTMFGNRGGCFHRDDGTLKARHWASRQWLVCVLSFKGRRRTLLQPGRYTELFFLDEATALAAGHRPCFECRRDDAVHFASLWSVARRLSASPSAPEMDRVLHEERLDASGSKRTFTANLGSLPAGCMVRHDGRPHLVSAEGLRPWSFEGYGRAISIAPDTGMTVLTPAATIAVIQAGYRPIVQAAASPKSA